MQAVTNQNDPFWHQRYDPEIRRYHTDAKKEKEVYKKMYRVNVQNNGKTIKTFFRVIK